MPGLHKGVSTQCTTQQQLAKPRHQPSDTDQQARDRLRNKAKIRSRAYIQLGEKALQTVHQTFEPNIAVIFHLPALTLQQIQILFLCYSLFKKVYIVCPPLSIQPEPIIVSLHRGNHSELTAQQAATKHQVSQQTYPLRPGETRVYPSMLADKQVPVLNLTESTITSQADLRTAFQSIHLCSTKDNELSHGGEESKEDEDTE